MYDSIKYKKYCHTKKGMITHMYNQQVHRSKRRKHPKPTYTKEELSKWMFSQESFDEIYNNWVASDYDIWLRPSCDRDDDYQGYSLDRLTLMTWKENFDKSKLDQKNGINNKMNKAILQFTLKGEFIKEFYSMQQASRETNIAVAGICRCSRGEYKRAGKFIWKEKEEGGQ